MNSQREAEIDRIVEELGKLWKRVPEWRLGQLISNVTRLGDRDVFFVQDKEIEDGLNNTMIQLLQQDFLSE